MREPGADGGRLLHRERDPCTAARRVHHPRPRVPRRRVADRARRRRAARRAAVARAPAHRRPRGPRGPHRRAPRRRHPGEVLRRDRPPTRARAAPSPSSPTAAWTTTRSSSGCTRPTRRCPSRVRPSTRCWPGTRPRSGAARRSSPSEPAHASTRRVAVADRGAVPRDAVASGPRAVRRAGRWRPSTSASRTSSALGVEAVRPRGPGRRPCARRRRAWR